MEIRTRDIGFSLSENNVIEGRAIVFNSVSNVMYDRETKRFFQEIIAPEAISQELIDNSDIKFTVNHDKEKTVARRKCGRGSLKVEKRDDGVYFSFEKPETTVGNDLFEMVKRGDITSCSFAFVDGDDIAWDFSNRQMPVRTVKSIRLLTDLSAVLDPAYEQTEVTARSIDEMTPTDEPETREAETSENPVPVEENQPENIVDESYKIDLQVYKSIVDKL